MVFTARITKKGQVTIPRQIRKILDSAIVEFEVDGEDVFIRPVKSVAGSLSSYAKNGGDFNEIRDLSWDSAVKNGFPMK
jgi:AbrB family looped-hinge helix DNA binding protein